MPPLEELFPRLDALFVMMGTATGSSSFSLPRPRWQSFLPDWMLFFYEGDFRGAKRIRPTINYAISASRMSLIVFGAHTAQLVSANCYTFDPRKRQTRLGLRLCRVHCPTTVPADYGSTIREHVVSRMNVLHQARYAAVNLLDTSRRGITTGYRPYN